MPCLDTLLSDLRIVHDQPGDFFPRIERLVEYAIEGARHGDTRIWEFRFMLRPYTVSRAMCWVAVHRGTILARRLGCQDHAACWKSMAECERGIVLRGGCRKSPGFFTRALDGSYADASRLLLETLGVVHARDLRFVDRVDAYARRPVDRGRVLRYRTDDDFGATSSAFTICRFWWGEALALMGLLQKAIEVFRRVARDANPLGPSSQDVDPSTGALRGNFPRACTPVGLMYAAITLGELLEARDGRMHAWT